MRGFVFFAVMFATVPAYADDVDLNLDTEMFSDAFGACLEENDVVGHRRCTRYASWARTGPNVFIELGFHARQLVGPPRTPRAPTTAAASKLQTGPTKKPEGGSVGLTFVERLAVRVARPLYIGAEAELTTPVTLVGETYDSPAFLFGFSGVAGLGVPLGFGDISGELVAGGRLVEHGVGETSSEGSVEVRGRFSLWLSPWCSLGVVGGRSLLNKGEWMAGISFGVESYAYGRDRTR